MKKPRTIDLSGISGMDNPDRVNHFGVIIKLRELGVNEELSLSQVSLIQPALAILTHIETARCRRRSIQWEVFASRRVGRSLLSGGKRFLHPVRNPDRSSPNFDPKIYRHSFDNPGHRCTHE